MINEQLLDEKILEKITLEEKKLLFDIIFYIEAVQISTFKYFYNSKIDNFCTKQKGACGLQYKNDKFYWWWQDEYDIRNNLWNNNWINIKAKYFDNINDLIQFIKDDILKNLSLKFDTNTFKIKSLYKTNYGSYNLICSELINNEWKDGYYSLSTSLNQKTYENEYSISKISDEIPLY